MVDFHNFIRNEETVKAIVFNGTKQMMLDIVRDNPESFEIRSQTIKNNEKCYLLMCKTASGNIMKVKRGSYIVIDSLGNASVVEADDFAIQYRGIDEDVPIYDICTTLASARNDNYKNANSAWKTQYQNMARALLRKFAVARL